MARQLRIEYPGLEMGNRTHVSNLLVARRKQESLKSEN
jgi:hypothetical protein